MAKYLALSLILCCASLSHAVLVEEEFSFTSSFDGVGPIYATAVYESGAQNLPLMLVQTGYSGLRSSVLYSARRMAENGFFCVAVALRGRDISAGSRDDGGIEIMDIYDAIEKSKQLYGAAINPNRISIIGYSNGGGNVFFSVVRFPYTFGASMVLFGIPDYGQWIDLVSVFRTQVIAAVGGTPQTVPDKYMVRRAPLAAANLSGTRFHIAYDSEETLTPPVMDEAFVAAVPESQQSNLFVNISHPDDVDRWTHAYNTTGHLNAIEDIFMQDIQSNQPSAPVMPDSGMLTVLGFVVTPKFTCVLGKGDDAAATMNFNFTSSEVTFEFSRLSSDNTASGKMTLSPDVFNSDIEVIVNGGEPVILEQGQSKEFNFPITSTVTIRPYVPPVETYSVYSSFTEMVADPDPNLLLVTALTDGSLFHWFGYYDVWEFDTNDRYLLGAEVNFEGRSPVATDEITLALIDTQNSNEWSPFASTTAWNWQQTCRLMWRPDSDTEIVYNDRENDHYVARVYDIQTQQTRTLPYPIYDISPDGQWGLGLDFTRVGDCRPGYGYNGFTDPYAGENAPAESGIYLSQI